MCPVDVVFLGIQITYATKYGSWIVLLENCKLKWNLIYFLNCLLHLNVTEWKDISLKLICILICFNIQKPSMAPAGFLVSAQLNRLVKHEPSVISLGSREPPLCLFEKHSTNYSNLPQEVACLWQRNGFQVYGVKCHVTATHASLSSCFGMPIQKRVTVLGGRKAAISQTTSFSSKVTKTDELFFSCLNLSVLLFSSFPSVVCHCIFFLFLSFQPPSLCNTTTDS